MTSLDKLDRKILYELDKNCRLSSSEIARKVRQGRDRVDYRIDRLIDSRILRKFTASINLATLGFTIYKMYLRLDASKDESKIFLKFLKSHSRVYWIAVCDGSWDLMIAIFAQSASEYYKTQQEILSQFNELILSFEMYQLVELDVYNKHYLVNGGESFVTIGGKNVKINLDDLDLKLLKELSRNARRTNVELAQTLKTTPGIIKSRIDKLCSNHVITGFRIELDLVALEMEFFKAQLFLRSYDLKLLKSLRDYCKQHLHITYFIQQLGSSMIEVEIEANSYRHYYEIIEELRSSFPTLIRNFQTVIVRKTFFNWMPDDLEKV